MGKRRQSEQPRRGVQATLPANSVSDAVGNALDGNADGTAGDDYSFRFATLSATGDTYVRRDSSSAGADIWINAPTPGQGSPTRVIPLAQLSALVITGGSGDDRITVDLSGGSPLPSDGLRFDGGAGANALTLLSTAADDAITADAGRVTFATSGVTAPAIYVANVQTLRLRGGSGGSDAVNVVGGARVVVPARRWRRGPRSSTDIMRPRGGG